MPGYPPLVPTPLVRNLKTKQRSNTGRWILRLVLMLLTVTLCLPPALTERAGAAESGAKTTTQQQAAKKAAQKKAAQKKIAAQKAAAQKAAAQKKAATQKLTLREREAIAQKKQEALESAALQQRAAQSSAQADMPTAPVAQNVQPQSVRPEQIWQVGQNLSLTQPQATAPATAPAAPAYTSSAAPMGGSLSGRTQQVALQPQGASAFYTPGSLKWAMFNAAASALGMPPLTSSVDGLKDEGLGFHADGSTRRAGGADAANNMNGRRSNSYATAGIGQQGPWLYDVSMGITRDTQGRFWDMGSEYSGLRARQNIYGPGGRGDNLFDSVLQRGLSSGMGFANTAVESAILGLMGKDSPYGNGKVRLNFYVDADGRSPARLQGEGDILWPLFDNTYTTIYTQLGARSMQGYGDSYGPDRWIGNVGLGQRWFPGASVGEGGKVDSGNWMVGYNAFFDYDLTRDHQRGGVGLEAQYDWLKVATNWYFPLSDWKNSQDFDGTFVKERAAQGWDARVKGYLPFYREVAVTGSFTQWYGEKVGMFGPSNLEKDPRVWSYGLEYTPIPALTAYVNQRQSERGIADTEFGLRFVYNFGMGAEEQFKPSRVAEMRTVHGARHDFVDRENKIILEYQEKDRYHIVYAGKEGANIFAFRLTDGFSKVVVGKTVRVTAEGVVSIAETEPRSLLATAREVLSSIFSVNKAHAAASRNYITDGNGIVRVRVDDAANLDFIRLTAGETTATFDRPALGLGPKETTTIKTSSPTVTENGLVAVTLESTHSNERVTWKLSGPGRLLRSDASTNANGVATALLEYVAPSKAKGRSKAVAAAGTAMVQVTATIKNKPYTAPVEVSTATTTPTVLEPASTSLSSKEMTLLSLVNGPANTKVAWKLAAGHGTLERAEPKTNAQGTATAMLKAKPIGAGDIYSTAEVNGLTYYTKVVLTSTATPTLTPAKTEILNSEAIVLNLANADPGTTVSWNVSGSAATLSNLTTTVKDDGTATATLTASASGTGDAKVTATMGSKSATCTVAVKSLPTEISAAKNEIGSNEKTVVTLKNAAPGSTVSWSVSGSAATLSNEVTKADANGTATATLTAKALGSGDAKITATVGGKAYSCTVKVKHTAKATLTAAAYEILNGANTVITLRNAEPNATVTWSLGAGNAGKLSNQITKVDANGTATATLTATGAGNLVVTAKVGTQTLTTTVVAKNQMSLTAPKDTIIADEAIDFILANAPANRSIDCTISGPGRISGYTPSTDAKGEGWCRVTADKTKVGPVTVTAKVGSESAKGTVTVVKGAKTPTISAGASSLFTNDTTVITVKDAEPNAAVTWSLGTGNPGKLTNQILKVKADGTATATLTATGAGNLVVTAKVGTHTLTTTVVAKNRMSLTTPKPTITQGEEITLTLADAPANTSITWRLAGLGTEVSSSKQTDASGKGTFKLKASTTSTGRVSVTASIGGDNAFVAMQVIEAPKTPTITPVKAALNSKETTVITLKDATPKAAITWSVGSGNPGSLSGASTTVKDDGTATATLTANATGSGKVTVTAKVDGKDYTCAVQVTEIKTATISAAASNLFTNGTTVITVKNAEPNAAVTWSVAPSNLGTLTKQITTVKADGTATATLTATGAGNLVVTAKVGTHTLTTTVVAKNKMSLTAPNPTVPQGEEITFTLKDAAANTSVTWSKTGPGTEGTKSAKTDAKGEGTYTLKTSSTDAGPVTLKATVGSENATATVTVEKVSNATLKPQRDTISSDPTAPNTNTMLDLKDAPPNKTVNWTVSNTNFAYFKAVGSFDKKDTATSTTDDTGLSQLALYANTGVEGKGEVTVTAKIDGITHTCKVNVDSGKPASLSANPANPVVNTETRISPAYFIDGKELTWTTDPKDAGTMRVYLGTYHFTPTKTEKVTLTATDGTNTASTTLTVTAGEYTLEASPGMLFRGIENNVTFTLTMNGAVQPNTKITFDLSNISDRTNPITKTTDKFGKVELTRFRIKDSISTPSINMYAKVNDTTEVKKTFSVGSGIYNIDLSGVTFNGYYAVGSILITDTGVPVPKIVVSLSDITLGGSNATAHTIPGYFFTGDDGRLDINAYLGSYSRKGEFIVKVGETTAREKFSTGSLPDPANGLIFTMDYSRTIGEAKKICADNGGRLPLIKGQTELNGVNPGDSIEGIGTVGGTPPEGLYNGNGVYTGTTNPYNKANYIVKNDGGKLTVNSTETQAETWCVR